MRKRYGVITVGGDLEPRKGGTTSAVGLSAHVIDRSNAHKVVATFRSETRLHERDSQGKLIHSPSLGQDGAREAAEVLAEKWNADDASA